MLALGIGTIRHGDLARARCDAIVSARAACSSSISSTTRRSGPHGNPEQDGNEVCREPR